MSRGCSFLAQTRRSLILSITPRTLAYARFRQTLRLNGTATLSSVSSAPVGSLDIEAFRSKAYDVEQPLVLQQYSTHLPAFRKWFVNQDEKGVGSSHKSSVAPYLKERLATTAVPYELIMAPSELASRLSDANRPLPPALRELFSSLSRDSADYPLEEIRLHQFTAPAALFLAALGLNQASDKPLTRLYIAQAPLADLPREMQEDVPAPQIVTSAGRGDVYGSSLWLGLTPTYTPWHRDPNPNLLCQLCGDKVLRLLPPQAGEHEFWSVQAALSRSAASSRIRGEEMMHGPERELLHDRIWGSDPPGGIMEARLGAGDAVFIPKGWWHSVKSVAVDGALNASVNWWFR